jgi:3-hydroxyacyl-CoA dehydrogenase
MPSEYQTECTRPERVVLAHPFNPPHLIPLVEVVGGRQTSVAAVERTMAFFHSVGKKPIRLRREIRGHIANRLQAALWQEAFHLVESGVASVSDVDAAIAHGPGLRWALLGPFLNLHLSGGPQGLAHVLAHLGPPTESMWRDLGTVHLNPELNEKLVAGVEDELTNLSFDEMLGARDALLQQLIKLKAAEKKLP